MRRATAERAAVLAAVVAVWAATWLATGPASGAPQKSLRGAVVDKHGDAVIDWTRGVIGARGAAAGDLRAPSAAVGRVGAERDARTRARATLKELALALPVAGGGTVADQVGRDPAARARLDAAVDRSLLESVRYSTDGSAMVHERLPLEAVRLALTGAPGPPEAPDGAPTAVIVDASKQKKLLPGLGLALSAGGERYAGPTVYYRDLGAAAADPRLGANVARMAASASDEGTIELDGEVAGELAGLRKAGALVVVVLPGSKR